MSKKIADITSEMSFTKFATLEDAQVLDIKGSPTKLRQASLDKLSDYDNYRTGDGYMYVRIRAISSRVNKNHDGWPSVELAGGKDIFTRHARQSSSGFVVEAKEGSNEYGFATFLGKPNFIDHNNSDPSRARGVVVDAKLRVLPEAHVAAYGDDYWTSGAADPEHLPPTEVELLIEIDAQQFPKYANAVRKGELDGFSMGCDVDLSKCSHCGHEATNPTEYCSHILMKGAHHDFKTADGKRVSKKSYENCYGIKFFEISGVFEPADETALAREVVSAIQHEGIVQTENEDVYAPDPLRGHYHGEVAAIAEEIRRRNPDIDEQTSYDLAQRRLTNPANAVPREDSIEDVAPKRWNYAPGVNNEGLPPDPITGQPAPRVERPGVERRYPEGEAGDREREFADAAEELLEQQDPRRRPVMNDPVMSKTAEAEEPQSMHTKAPDEVDTLRQEKICPLCGNVMEGHTCDVCNYEEPPEGLGNPDLDHAKQVKQELEQAEQEPTPEVSPSAPQPGAPPGGHPHALGQSFLQARNPQPTASVMSEMRWAPQIDERLAGRINKQEKPLKPGTTSNGGPTDVTVVKNPTQPVTSAMRTAQELIQATNQQGDTMSNTVTADSHGATPLSDTSADARVDVTGVGGVIDASNEQASKSASPHGKEGEYAQTDVTGVGSTGVTNVDADKSESLPTAGADDAGFNTDKNIEAIPTKTYDDTDGTEEGARDPVTDKAFPQDAEAYKGSSVLSYDAKPFYDQPGLSGGSANKGTQPSDPVGKAEDRVDVLKPTATPENNSGPTSQWTGTDGNKVLRQQEPVTDESIARGGQGSQEATNWTSHVVACLKLADLEVDLGLTEKEKKYDRISELEQEPTEVVAAEHAMLSRVRTAGLAKLEQRKIAMRLPSGFGQATAAGRRFATALDGELPAEDQPVDLAEDQLDSGLFT